MLTTSAPRDEFRALPELKLTGLRHGLGLGRSESKTKGAQVGGCVAPGIAPVVRTSGRLGAAISGPCAALDLDDRTLHVFTARCSRRSRRHVGPVHSAQWRIPAILRNSEFIVKAAMPAKPKLRKAPNAIS